MPRVSQSLPAALLATALVAACDRGGRPPRAIGPDEGTAHPNVGRQAPNIAAQDPSGPWLPLRSLEGRPVALLLFRTGAPYAEELARAFSAWRDDPAYAPTVFLGMDSDSLDRIKQFIESRHISLPILRDAGPTAASFGVRDLPTVVLLDADHVIRFQLDGYAGAAFRPRLLATEAFLRTLPAMKKVTARPLDIDYARHPRAPLFTGRDLDGRAVDLAALKGRAVVLTFFDQQCPHCQKDLPRLARVLREFRPRGVAAIGVTSRDLGGGLRSFLRDHGVDFPVVVDAGRAIFARYDSTHTPETFFIDRDGLVRFREEGDRVDREDVTRLQLRLLLGEDPAALAAALQEGRYAGDGICRSCHEGPWRDWLFTPHSLAWDSLREGDKWRDPECVGCHVTGRGRPGGFADPDTTPQMVNVQCEVCHGPGGGHSGGAAPDREALARVCSDCHSGKFVLRFDLEEALALVVHREQPEIERLSRLDDEHRLRLQAINARRLEKFRPGVAYLGADACRDCHRREYDDWVRTPHAGAFAHLLQAGRGGDPACQPCHTTGMGRKGGFGQAPPTQGPMTGVQCEVCHGPGEDHVGSPQHLKQATIYGITDQCSFCIIQGVCAACHDRPNDPDFDIERTLPLVRHASPPS